MEGATTVQFILEEYRLCSGQQGCKSPQILRNIWVYHLCLRAESERLSNTTVIVFIDASQFFMS
ncbi:hypothetical protein J1N35_041238 [Gossypium stocksii]|uniref:Uncharacterized protein n=1 Tax=Gossypium stocksii TaxID=47602 RepID=A0A9D3UF95_9ROSI|nr:hypothetical protein J1N35_041238 [Gossypium stocksii]